MIKFMQNKKKKVYSCIYTPSCLLPRCGLLKEQATFNFSYEERERFMFAFLEADKSLRNKTAIIYSWVLRSFK